MNNYCLDKKFKHLQIETKTFIQYATDESDDHGLYLAKKTMNSREPVNNDI